MPVDGLQVDPRVSGPGRADEIVQRHSVGPEVIEACTDLTMPVNHPTTRGNTPSLRWALAHMIEETGRHAGHADILRELIDGATGR